MCFRYIAAQLPRFAENITSRNKEDIAKGTIPLVIQKVFHWVRVKIALANRRRTTIYFEKTFSKTIKPMSETSVIDRCMPWKKKKRKKII